MKRFLFSLLAVGLLCFSTGCCSWWWPWGYYGHGNYGGGCPGGNCGVAPGGGQFVPPQQGAYYPGLDSVESVQLNGPQTIPGPVTSAATYPAASYHAGYPPTAYEPAFVPRTAAGPLQSLPTY
ncbi:MAG: hypothetical protein ACE5KM_20815 [Planctomycetaceae bacterium]